MKKLREHMEIAFEKHVAQSLTTAELSDEILTQSPNFGYGAFLSVLCSFSQVTFQSLLGLENLNC